MPVTNQDIKEKLEGIEDALTGVVDDIKETAKKAITFPLWVKIVAGLGFVCLVVLLVTMFTKSKPVDDSYLKEVRQLDSTIKYQQKYIEALVEGQAMRDSIIIKELGRISGNKTTIVRLKTEYEKIPTDVRNLDREQLRREWTEY